MKNQHLTELEQVPTNIFNEVLSSLWYRKLVNSQLVVNKVTKEQVDQLNTCDFCSINFIVEIVDSIIEQ